MRFSIWDSALPSCRLLESTSFQETVHRALRHARRSRSPCGVTMGADPDEATSSFSVVSDSIRRDREALFTATRANVPTIESDSDRDSEHDGSSDDAEVPVFFTADLRDECGGDAAGFGFHESNQASELALAQPQGHVPLDFARNRDARTCSVSPAPDTRNNENLTPTTMCDADAFAAFEAAASDSLRREEEKSHRAVANHLAWNTTNPLTFDDCDGFREASSSVNGDDVTVRGGNASAKYDDVWDDAERDSSSDDEVSIRARRRKPPPRVARRVTGGTTGATAGATTTAGATAATATTAAEETEKTHQPPSSEFAGWLSGAAGRIAGDRSCLTETHTTADDDYAAMTVAMTAAAVPDLDDAPTNDAVLAQVEHEFVALTCDETFVGSQPHAPSVPLNLASVLGGLDLDGLLKRLQAPGGEETVKQVRERSEREGLVGLDSSGDDERRDAKMDSQNGTPGWVHEGNGKGRGRRRPHTARLIAHTPSTGDGKGHYEYAPHGRPRDLDPYGRGTSRQVRARERTLGRPSSAAPSPTKTFEDVDSETEETPLAFTGADVARRETVKINAWDTGRSIPDDGPGRESELPSVISSLENNALLGVTKTPTDAPASPSADRAEAAAGRARAAAKAAEEAAAATNYSLHMDLALEFANSEARQQTVENTELFVEKHAREELLKKSQVKAKSFEGRAMDAYYLAKKSLDRKKGESLAVKSVSPTAPAFPVLTPPSPASLAKCETFRLQGNALFRQGEYVLAKENFGDALVLNPTDCASLANRAAAKLRLGDFVGAEKDASDCLAIDSNQTKALHRRAIARKQLGNHDGSLADLEKLALLLPNHSGTAVELAEARRFAAHRKDGGEFLEKEMETREALRRDAAVREGEIWEAKRTAGVQLHRARALAQKQTQGGK